MLIRSDLLSLIKKNDQRKTDLNLMKQKHQLFGWSYMFNTTEQWGLTNGVKQTENVGPGYLFNMMMGLI